MHLRRDNQRDGSQDTHPSSILHACLVINFYLLISQKDASCICGAVMGKMAILPRPLIDSPVLGSLSGGEREEKSKDQVLWLWFIEVGSGSQL